MVEMRVRQENGVNRMRSNRKRLPVPFAEFFLALEQAAVDQDSVSAGVDKVFRPGDSPSRTEKRQRRHPVL